MSRVIQLLKRNKGKVNKRKNVGIDTTERGNTANNALLENIASLLDIRKSMLPNRVVTSSHVDMNFYAKSYQKRNQHCLKVEATALCWEKDKASQLHNYGIEFEDQLAIISSLLTSKSR